MPGPAIRFLLEYKGDRVSLISRQALSMLLPPSDPIDGFNGLAGFWYELRDSRGRPIYRRVIRNPIQYHVELHEESHEDSSEILRQRLVETPKGVFTLVVPDLPQAMTLALCSSPFTKAYGPATEIATFPVHSVA